MAKKQTPLTVETLTHDEATRKNIPTAEYESVMQKDEQSAIRIAYERCFSHFMDRNGDMFS
jgi:adenine-specific DNA-methyltransferase